MFSNMLQTDMKEKIDEVVEIDDASMKDVRELYVFWENRGFLHKIPRASYLGRSLPSAGYRLLKVYKHFQKKDQNQTTF